MNKYFVIALLVIVICLTGALLCSCDSNAQQNNKAIVISFNANGGVFPGNISAVSITLNKNDTIELPEHEPIREGYVFVGWYLDLSFNSADKLNIDLFKAVESRTIFAKWQSVDTYPHEIFIASYDVAEIKTNLNKTAKDTKITAAKGTEITLEISYIDHDYILKPGSLCAKSNDGINDDIIINDDTKSFLMPPYPITIIAIFELPPLKVNVYKQENVIINVSKELAHRDDTVYVDAIPSLGYYINKIYIIETSESVSDSFLMPSKPVTIAAEVVKINCDVKYDVTIDETNNIKINTFVTKASTGEYVPIEIICDEGFICTQLLINNQSTTDIEGFIMPNDTVLIKPIIQPINKQKLYNLTIQVKESSGTPSDKIITTTNIENRFYEGEKIVLDTSYLDNVKINNILLNGNFVSLDNLIMPNEDSVLTITLSPQIYKIKVSDTYSPKPIVSHDFATEGELIKLELENTSLLAPNSVEFKYINLNSTLYEEVNIELDGISSYSGSFLMPSYDIEIKAIPKHVTSTNEYHITITQMGNGNIESNSELAQFNELVELDINPAEGFGLFSLVVKHGQNGEQEDTLVSYSNETDIDTYFSQSKIGFLMKNSNINIMVIFKPTVIINACEDEFFLIYPDKSITFEGESVTVFINSRANNHQYSVTQIRYNLTGIINNTFTTPDNTPIINLNYDKIVNTSNVISYRVDIDNSYGGNVSTIKNTNTYSSGALVELSILADKGYKLKSLKLYKTSNMRDEGENISDIFTMKEYDVTIIPEFIPMEFSNFSLINRYRECAKKLYTDFGVFLRCLNNYTVLNEHFKDSETIKISSLIKHMEIVIYAQTDWGNKFYIINLNKLTMLNKAAQILDKYVKYYYFNTFVKTEIIDNYIIVSIDGVPSEDYYVFRNGLFKDTENKCILFKRPTGTYGVYCWISKKWYIDVPKEFSENGQSYRIIDYLGKNSFNAKQRIIKGINLSNVKELAPYSLYNLQIKSIDLSYVTSINSTALMGLNNIKFYLVAKDNPVLSQEDGVLFDKSKKRLISYPAGATKPTYIVPQSVAVINDFAFYGASFLSEVKFLGRGKLIEIREYAFSSMQNLQKIYTDRYDPEEYMFNFSDIDSPQGLHVYNYAFFNTPNVHTYKFTNLKELGNSSLYWDGETNLTIDLKDNKKEVITYNHIFNGGMLDTYDYNKLNILLPNSKISYYANHPIWSTYLVSE